MTDKMIYQIEWGFHRPQNRNLKTKENGLLYECDDNKKA